MATPNIRPFRDVSEHFVLNLFSYSGSIPTAGVPRGTFVKINSGWQSTQTLQDGGPVGGFTPGSPASPISRRYRVPATVTIVGNSGDNVLGITLYETRELDENGVPLAFNKAKQAQLQAVLSGEAVPIATKGVFLYSGVIGTPTGGALAYVQNDGILTSSGNYPTNTLAIPVGRFLGPVDSNGWVLFQLDLPF